MRTYLPFLTVFYQQVPFQCGCLAIATTLSLVKSHINGVLSQSVKFVIALSVGTLHRLQEICLYTLSRPSTNQLGDGAEY